MHDLAQSLASAVLALLPTLKSNPKELRKRLARRSLPSLTRPPRAWCLAVRASDTRITPTNADIDPEYAVEPAYRRKRLKTKIHESRPLPVSDEIKPHTVRLTSALLARLCPPVLVQFGLTPREIGPLLGISESFVHNLRRAGLLRFDRRPLLHGRRGIGPLMLVESTTLDPSSLSLKRLPDPLWLSLWQYQIYQLPHIDQTIPRHAYYRNIPNRARTRSTLRFQGFKFLCPCCFRPARLLYYPLPPITLPGLHRPLKRLAKLLPGGLQLPPLPTTHGGPTPSPTSNQQPATSNSPPTFACQHCHRIHYSYHSAGPTAWNDLVSFLTAGLLRGHEVPLPPGYAAREPTHKRPLSAPLQERRDRVLTFLLDTNLTARQIVQEMDTPYETVHNDIGALYKQHNVTTRHALILLLRPTRPIPTLPPKHHAPKHTEFLTRLAAGHTPAQIAKDLNLTAPALGHHMRKYQRNRHAISPSPMSLLRQAEGKVPPSKLQQI